MLKNGCSVMDIDQPVKDTLISLAYSSGQISWTILTNVHEKGARISPIIYTHMENST